METPPPPPPQLLPPPHSLTFSGVLAESKRIITARYFHFVTLSLLFLPLSVSVLRLRLRLSDHLFPSDPSDHSDHQQLLFHYLLYTLTIHLISISAIATITYTTHRTLSGEHATVISAVRSLTSSFFPLVSTAAVAHVLLSFISATFLTFTGTILILFQTLGFPIDYTSIYFISFSAISISILVSILTYFHIEWSLAFVVVVVESKWGFSPLMRSSYLIKGMRSVSLFVTLYFGVFGAILVWLCSENLDSGFVTMLGVFFLMMFFLRFTAANTVLYSYCKALHGELVIGVAEGFVHDHDHYYLNLPSDVEKIPHVVAVAVAA